MSNNKVKFEEDSPALTTGNHANNLTEVSVEIKIEDAPDTIIKEEAQDEEVKAEDTSDILAQEEADRKLAMSLSLPTRRTRHSSSRPKVASAPKKKRKVNPNRKPANNRFNAPAILSAELSAVLECERLSRPQVVKKLWEYIKLHNLQDPKDKRFILADEKLKTIFNKPRISMFKMNAVLSKHIKNADEVIDGMVGIEDEEGHEESGDDDSGAAVKDEESSLKKPTLASTNTTGDRRYLSSEFIVDSDQDD